MRKLRTEHCDFMKTIASKNAMHCFDERNVRINRNELKKT
jgi:hypothetical protein